MSRIFRYLRGYKPVAIAAPFMKLAEALLELYVPILVANAIDDGIKASNSDELIKNCVLIAAFGVAGLLLSVVSQWFSAKASVGYVSALRSDLFAKLVKISKADVEKAGKSALITRLTSDTDKLQNGINMGLRLLLRSPFVVFGSVLMAALIDKTAGLIFGAVVLVLFAVVFFVIYGGIPLQSRSSEQLEKVTGKVRGNIRGVRVIRAFGREEEELESFDSVNDTQRRASVIAGSFSAIMNPLTFAVINIGIIIVLKYSGTEVLSGTLKAGSVVALYNYMAQILTELVKLANLTLTISKAVSCGKRVFAVLDIPDEASPTAPLCADGSDFALEFRNVSFRYPGAGADSLTDISFALKPGESLGILGGTGSGKTTLANLIPSLYYPTKGEIYINGREVREYRPDALRELVSMVPQKTGLFTESIADNIRRGRESAGDEEVLDALRAAEALEFTEKKGGLESEVLSGGSNFSGGQKQRLTIARALVAKSDFLVLDDCLSALDYRTDRQVRRNIEALEPRPTTVIISQRPSSLLACSRILVLEDGACAAYGTPSELYETSEIYREIYDSQFGGKEAENE